MSTSRNNRQHKRALADQPDALRHVCMYWRSIPAFHSTGSQEEHP